MVTRGGGIVTAADLPWPLADPQRELPDVIDLQLHSAGVSIPSTGIDLKEYLSSLEKQMIERALEESGGVVQQAARVLGIGRTTLVEKIRRYGIR